MWSLPNSYTRGRESFVLLSTNVSKMQPVKAGTRTPHTHVAAVTLAKCCETGVQAQTGTQTFLPSRLFNLASPVTQGFQKKNNLEKKKFISTEAWKSRRLKILRAAPVNHNQMAIPVCSPSLLLTSTQLRGLKTKISCSS